MRVEAGAQGECRQSGVDALGDDVHHPVEQFEANVQLGVELDQSRQRRRQVTAAKAEAAADAQQPSRRLPGHGQLIEQLVHIGEDTQRPALGTLAILGQRNAPGGAMQQAGAEGGFEDLDALADVCGRQAELLGRSREALPTSEDEEQPGVALHCQAPRSPWRCDARSRGVRQDRNLRQLSQGQWRGQGGRPGHVGDRRQVDARGSARIHSLSERCDQPQLRDLCRGPEERWNPQRDPHQPDSRGGSDQGRRRAQQEVPQGPGPGAEEGQAVDDACRPAEADERAGARRRRGLYDDAEEGEEIGPANCR